MLWVYLSTLIVSCWIQFHNNFVWSFCVRPSGCFLDLLTWSGRIKKSDWPSRSWHLTFQNFFFYITLKTSVLQKPTWSQLLPNKAAMMPKLQNNIRANRMWPPVRQTILLAASGRLLGEIPQALNSQLPWLALALASLSSDKIRQVSQLGPLSPYINLWAVVTPC